MTPLRDVGLRNRRSVSWGAIPRGTSDDFAAGVCDALRDGSRLVSFFGMPEDADHACLLVGLLHTLAARLDGLLGRRQHEGR